MAEYNVGPLGNAGNALDGYNEPVKNRGGDESDSEEEEPDRDQDESEQQTEYPMWKSTVPAIKSTTRDK